MGKDQRMLKYILAAIIGGLFVGVFMVIDLTHASKDRATDAIIKDNGSEVWGIYFPQSTFCVPLKELNTKQMHDMFGHEYCHHQVRLNRTHYCE